MNTLRTEDALRSALEQLAGDAPAPADVLPDAAADRLERQRRIGPGLPAPIEGSAPGRQPTRPTRWRAPLAAAVTAVLLAIGINYLATRGDQHVTRQPALRARPTISPSGTGLASMSCLADLQLIGVRITGTSGDHPLPEINYLFRYAGDTPCTIPTWATTADLRSAAGPIVGQAKDVSLVGGPTHLPLTRGTRIAVAIGWRSPCSASSTSTVTSIDLRFAPDQTDQSRVLRVPAGYPQNLASCAVTASDYPTGWIEPIREIQHP